MEAPTVKSPDLVFDHNDTAEDFCAAAARGEVFSFSRWGDGEWTALLGKDRPRNCDGHPYSLSLTGELCDAMTDVGQLFRDGVIRKGISGIAHRQYHNAMDRYFGEFPRPEWYNADIFHNESYRASKEGRKSCLVDMLQNRDDNAIASTIVVGPSCFIPLKEVFPVDTFVEVSRENAYGGIAMMEAELRLAISRLPAPCFVSISASMAANVLIHRLRDLATQHWFWDLGSVWQPYVPSHGFHVRSCQREVRPVL